MAGGFRFKKSVQFSDVIERICNTDFIFRVFWVGLEQLFIDFNSLFIILFCRFRFPASCMEVPYLVKGSGYICYYSQSPQV
jgi:hypothetical protein